MSGSTITILLAGRRKRWFSITWGLFLTAVLVLPNVDHSIQKYHEMGELRGELASRDDLPQRARKLADRVAEKQEQIADLEASLVPADALSSLKQDITRMIRDAKCQLRSIRPGPASRQPLEEVLSGTPGDSAKRATKKPVWEVEEQITSVSIQGTFAHLTQFLSLLDSDVRIVQLASLVLHAPPDTGGEVVLDLNIKTFDLYRKRPG